MRDLVDIYVNTIKQNTIRSIYKCLMLIIYNNKETVNYLIK